MNEINKLDSMKKFDNFLKVPSYYHVERCEYEDCPQCLLQLIYVISMLKILFNKMIQWFHYNNFAY